MAFLDRTAHAAGKAKSSANGCGHQKGPISVPQFARWFATTPPLSTR